MQKALITGASGFIGRRVRSALLERGVEVVAIRRKGSPPATEGRSVEADYADADGVQRVLEAERPDVIFHVAGVTKGVTYEDFRRGNVMPTEHLLRGCAGLVLTRFVLISSQAAYGPAEPSRPVRESDPRRPIEHYGRSKLEAERVVEKSGVPFTILRPSGVFGPADVDFLELFKAANKRVNLFFGNRGKWMSVIYVDDCVRAILESAEHEATVNKGYFLTDDVPTTWGAFQQLIVEAMPHRCVDVNLPAQLVTLAAHGGELLTKFDGKPRLMNRQKAIMGAQRAWLVSGEAATQDFAFRAEIDHREGIRRTDAWYRDNGWY